MDDASLPRSPMIAAAPSGEGVGRGEKRGIRLHLQVLQALVRTVAEAYDVSGEYVHVELEDVLHPDVLEQIYAWDIEETTNEPASESDGSCNGSEHGAASN